MLLRPVNKRVACIPPASNQIKVTVKSAFARVDQKVELIGLEIKYGSDQFDSGVIYISGESATNHAWAKQVYDLGDGPFILVPEDMVLMYRKP